MIPLSFILHACAAAAIIALCILACFRRAERDPIYLEVLGSGYIALSQLSILLLGCKVLSEIQALSFGAATLAIFLQLLSLTFVLAIAQLGSLHLY